MQTVIEIQDAYIARVSKYDPTGSTYATLCTKAGKKARYALIDQLGLTDTQARQAVSEAHDVAHHQWMIENAPSVIDDLNYADGNGTEQVNLAIYRGEDMVDVVDVAGFADFTYMADYVRARQERDGADSYEFITANGRTGKRAIKGGK